MISESKTEQQMREEKAPTPSTIKELNEYIESLIEMKHDYGTCVYAMSLAATAAFNFVASRLGVTGFQVSCADLDVLRRTRSMEGPFMIIDGNNMLYPQYDIEGEVKKKLVEWEDWAAEQAEKKLAEGSTLVAPRVVKHWEMLAAKRNKKEE